MNSNFDPRRRTLLAAVVLVFSAFCMQNAAADPVDGAQAAIKTVADFDATTWRTLLRTGPRPAAYVFTNSFCATCPEVFELLQQTTAGAGQAVELAAILMDVRGERALAHARHYAGATRIYAFDGFEPAIRKAVDPKWHNITPYVVLVARNGRLQRVIGPPDAKQLQTWLD